MNGLESPEYYPVGGTDIGLNASAALRSLDAVSGEWNSRILLAAAAFHGFGMRTTVIQWQTHEPKIELTRVYLFAVDQRVEVVVCKK